MLTLTAILLGALNAPSFGIVHEFPIPGNDGWDLLTVNSESQRLYISRGTHVQVMATDTGQIVADIPNTQGVHAIALAPRLKKGFITNGRDNSVGIFDLTTNKEKTRVKVGENPDAILFDKATGRVFAFNAKSNDVTVIDAKSEKVVGTVKFEGNPELPVSDDKGHVYVNLESKSEVVEIDARELKVTRSWSLAPGEEPTGLAFDKKHGLLFSTCANSFMAVSDVKSGKLLATAPIGSGPDSAGFDPKLGIAFSSNGEGTLSLIQAISGKFENVGNIPTKKSARTMALDESRHLVYLIAADFEEPAAGQRRGKMKPGTAEIIVVGQK
jgi:YVTN family beta-propeller protein